MQESTAFTALFYFSWGKVRTLWFPQKYSSYRHHFLTCKEQGITNDNPFFAASIILIYKESTKKWSTYLYRGRGPSPSKLMNENPHYKTMAQLGLVPPKFRLYY